MARYTGPKCRICRREGEKLFLKGDRCFTEKCAMERRPYAPGEHGQSRRRKQSEYGLQLREKQKTRRIYGVMENQFHGYYEQAARRKGVTGELLLQYLECRLDNVIYRLGLASSRTEGRQLVRHGHFLVNGRKMDIPSYEVREGDIIDLKQASRQLPRFQELAELAAARGLPEWLSMDWENYRGTVVRLPNREDIDIPVQEHLIVEMYSR
ncbi:MAG: 30S ribosomal protein S4 [Clostridia bacterium]